VDHSSGRKAGPTLASGSISAPEPHAVRHRWLRGQRQVPPRPRPRRHRGGQHEAIGVYDRITWGFIRYILGYRQKMAPRIRALMASHAGNAQVTVLRSRAAVRRYLVGPAAAARRSAGAAASREDQR
jgi:hypothetical protein